MAETAALLADEVFPDVPLRQWVISLTQSTRFAAYRDNRPPRFRRVKAPDKGELEDLVQLISKRVGRCLEEPAPRAKRVLWVKLMTH